MFLEGSTWTEIAETLGHERSTIWRWRQKPEFQRRLQSATDTVLAEVRSIVATGFAGAEKRLRDLENEPEAHAPNVTAASTRYNGAIRLLQGIKEAEDRDLERRRPVQVLIQRKAKKPEEDDSDPQG